MSSLHSLEVSLLSRPLSLLLPSLRPELPVCSLASSMVASPCRLEYFPSSAASRSVKPVAPLSIIFSLLILIKCCRISVITRLCSVLSPAAVAALLLRGAGSRMLPLTEARYLLIGSRVSR